jgi:hypothetical protein
MLFIEFRFFWFFLVVFSVYWSLRKNRSRKLWLPVCSYIFCAAWNWKFLFLLMGSSALDYLVGMMLTRTKNPRARHAWLILSLCANLGTIAFFKYYNFFVTSAATFLEWLGLPASVHTLNIVIPVGVSFYTFHSMSYTIDVYRGKLRAVPNVLDLACSIGFFPQMVAGPIVRAFAFLPQLKVPRNFSDVDVRGALVLFLTGLIKKACIADAVAPFADRYFAAPGNFTAASAWVGVDVCHLGRAAWRGAGRSSRMGTMDRRPTGRARDHALARVAADDLLGLRRVDLFPRSRFASRVHRIAKLRPFPQPWRGRYWRVDAMDCRRACGRALVEFTCLVLGMVASRPGNVFRNRIRLRRGDRSLIYSAAILDLAKKKGVRFLLPVDALEAQKIEPGATARNTSRVTLTRGITDGWQAVDIGHATISLYEEEIAKAKTILWNGPVGIFEIPAFATGTIGIAEALARSKATTIIGGDDSVTAVKQAGLADKMTFISTGGGASLELIEGKELPGIVALK